MTDHLTRMDRRRFLGALVASVAAAGVALPVGMAGTRWLECPPLGETYAFGFCIANNTERWLQVRIDTPRADLYRPFENHFTDVSMAS
jgi:hypothetical protein